MTAVLASLALLAVGAAASLALARAPRLALYVAMGIVILASALVAAAGVDVLLRSSPPVTVEVAWPLALGTARLSVDGLSAWFLMTIGALAACVAVYSVPYLSSAVGREPVPAFCALFCGLVASLILLVCAADAVLFLIAWEAMTLAAFFLVAFRHDRPEVRRGAWMYLIATHIGTALFVLPLFGILFARAGTTAFSSFAGAVGPNDRAMLWTLFGLGVVGFGTKAGLMPMHVWLPAAHPVAPTPVSAMLSGVVVKTGVYALLRLLTWLPPLPPGCGDILLLVAVVSGVVGVLYALAQHDLKRLLAYHTVENVGIIALGVAVGMLGEAANEPALAVLGYAGALLHVTNHALFKGLLFLSAGAVMHGCGTGKIERLGGLARRTPVNALMFLIGAVAICGLPPLNGFVSEWVIYGSLFGGVVRDVGASGGLAAVGVAGLALMGGLALACFAKVFGVVFLGEPRDAGAAAHATPVGMMIACAALAAFCILIGVLPGVWVPLVRSAAGELANVPAGEVTARIEDVLSPAVKLSGMAVVLVGVVAALAAARRWALSCAARREGRGASPAATWGCGYARPTPRMQYTASSFAASLVNVFRSVLWPQRELRAPAGSFPGAAHVKTDAPDIAEHDLFEPLFRGVARLFAMVRTVSWRPDRPFISRATTVRECFPEGTKKKDQRSAISDQGPGTRDQPELFLTRSLIPDPRSLLLAEHRRRGPVTTLMASAVSALRRGSIQVRLLFIVLTLVLLFLIEAVSSAGRQRSTATPDSQRLETGAARR